MSEESWKSMKIKRKLHESNNYTMLCTKMKSFHTQFHVESIPMEVCDSGMLGDDRAAEFLL